MSMFDVFRDFAVLSALFLGASVMLGVGLLVAAACLNGLWRYWGWGQMFVAFWWWRRQAGTVRVQHLQGGEWVTLERLPEQFRTFREPRQKREATA